MSPTNNVVFQCPDQQIASTNWLEIDKDTCTVLSMAQIRDIEHQALKNAPSGTLMKTAGLQSAYKIAEFLQSSTQAVTQIHVLAGPGNNGGDACWVAYALNQYHHNVMLWLLNPSQVNEKTDREQAINACKAQGVPMYTWGNMPFTLDANTLVIDGLLGIGCTQAPRGVIAEIIQTINQHRNNPDLPQPLSVIALDCPTGLNCDTGESLGQALAAHLTLSYIACKPGLLSHVGKDLCGKVLINSLGCDALIQDAEHAAPLAHCINHKEQLARLPIRQHQHHKGNFGHIGVIGGQAGMLGAPVLSARTALQLGAGRVSICLLSQQQTPWFDPLFPELMEKTLEEILEQTNILAIGPGLGQTEKAQTTLRNLLKNSQGHHMVWDADALNLLACTPALQQALQDYRQKHPDLALILTPHPLEAARLLQTHTTSVQAQRLDSARQIAQRFECTVVLKGPGSIIAQQRSQRVEINTTGGPALATAGSGDVLTGAIAAMLGQGCPELEAASNSVWLHGMSITPIHPSEPLLHVSHASEIALRMKQHLNKMRAELKR